MPGRGSGKEPEQAAVVFRACAVPAGRRNFSAFTGRAPPPHLQTTHRQVVSGVIRYRSPSLFAAASLSLSLSVGRSGLVVGCFVFFELNCGKGVFPSPSTRVLENDGRPAMNLITTQKHSTDDCIRSHSLALPSIQTKRTKVGSISSLFVPIYSLFMLSRIDSPPKQHPISNHRHPSQPLPPVILNFAATTAIVSMPSVPGKAFIITNHDSPPHQYPL